MRFTETLDLLSAIFQGAPSAAPCDAGVPHRQHALQAAELALEADAPAELVLAAWLHDIGHLVTPRDADHDAAGARWLAASGFSDEVTRLVAGHVQAKRYLAALSPRYADRLAPRSRVALQAQGGPMTADERCAYEARPEHGEALWLRHWDDRACAPDATVPDLEHLLALAERHLRRDALASTPI